MASKLLAPYGGITRIRFKGSSESFRTSQPLAPPLCRSQDRARAAEVNARKAARPDWRATTENQRPAYSFFWAPAMATCFTLV